MQSHQQCNAMTMAVSTCTIVAFLLAQYVAALPDAGGHTLKTFEPLPVTRRQPLAPSVAEESLTHLPNNHQPANVEDTPPLRLEIQPPESALHHAAAPRPAGYVLQDSPPPMPERPPLKPIPLPLQHKAGNAADAEDSQPSVREKYSSEFLHPPLHPAAEDALEGTPPELPEEPLSESTPPPLNPLHAGAAADDPPLLPNGPSLSVAKGESAIEEELQKFAVVAQPNQPPGTRNFSRDIMRVIVDSMRQYLHDIDHDRNQFAVIMLIPTSVTAENYEQQIHQLMNNEESYHWALPGEVENQHGIVHAEMQCLQDIQQYYQNFVQDHGQPQFAVLVTWIHPCPGCAEQIINSLGFGDDLDPAFGNIPTYVGYVTSGVLADISPNDREYIRRQFYNYYIGLVRIPYQGGQQQAVALESDFAGSNAYIQEHKEYSDTCLLGGKEFRKEFNCNREKGNVFSSTSQEETCATSKDPTCGFQTATGKTCKNSDDYRNYWCYTTDGSWDYVCNKGECGNHGNTKFDWCLSGSGSVLCNRPILPYPHKTVSNVNCRSDHKCGYYGYQEAWCYTDTGWDYCCASTCEQYGQKYDWCTTGRNEHQARYCKRTLPWTTRTAKGHTCRWGMNCDYHDGKAYSWCYIDIFSNNWDYCCTGQCAPHGTSSDWCTTGNTWTYCKVEEYAFPHRTHTHDLTPCLSGYRCGYHGKDYAWCYTGNYGSWDYCCTQECGTYGYKFDWCTTGTSGHWQHCRRDSLAAERVTAQKEPCNLGHSCDYHGKDYSWCYKDSGWDYCCSSSCGKYGTDSNYCAAGNTYSACSGNPYDQQ